MSLPRLEGFARAKTSKHLPAVLTREEVRAVFAQLDATPLLVAHLLYGAGLRLMEALRLRVKDVDFARGQILVRDGKGAKDRVTMLPKTVAPSLELHLAHVCSLHENDLARGFGEV